METPACSKQCGTPDAGNEARIEASLRELQGLPVRSTPGHCVAALTHVALIAGALASWSAGLWPLTILAWGAIAWMDHAALTRLHEAAHGTLSRWKWLNEAQGLVIGTASLTPLSVYRYVHARHHAHLGNERDPEFWPYNLAWTPRWVRITYAWAELCFGWLLTPALYSVRTAASWRSVPRRQRLRILIEWTILIAVWGSLLTIVNTKGWWEAFGVAHLVPAWLAGTMQTIRKFSEHLGMFGEGIFAMTRTVVYSGPMGRAASASQLHVEHHAAHHRYARIPYYVLPEATELVYANKADAPLFPNHLSAMLDMAPHLFNPRVGPQWAGVSGVKAAPGATPGTAARV